MAANIFFQYAASSSMLFALYSLYASSKQLSSISSTHGKLPFASDHAKGSFAVCNIKNERRIWYTFI